MARKNKHHIFNYINQSAKTLCGINDRDGIIFDNIKYVNCKNCLRINKNAKKGRR